MWLESNVWLVMWPMPHPPSKDPLHSGIAPHYQLLFVKIQPRLSYYIYLFIHLVFTCVEVQEVKTTCGSQFSFHCVDSEDWIQVLRLCGRYLLCHLPGPMSHSLRVHFSANQMNQTSPPLSSLVSPTIWKTVERGCCRETELYSLKGRMPWAADEEGLCAFACF